VGWGTEVEVNSLGFRGPEPRPGGPATLVALGDSVTFGNDLPYADTWPARLERALEVDRPGTAVHDLGLGGYDTVQEVATLEDLGLALGPSQVILGYCVNDVGVVSMSMETSFVEADRENPLFLSRIAQWGHAQRQEKAQRRALYERNREAAYRTAFAAEIAPLSPAVATRLEELRKAVEATPSSDQELASRRIPARWYASEARLGRLAFAFDRLATLAEQHAFEVTVLLIPYLAEDPLIDRGLDLVGQLAAERGFAVVDPRPSFRAAGLEALRLRPEDPVHPNARGHALLAEALALPLQAD